jgi:hypothetical protein
MILLLHTTVASGAWSGSGQLVVGRRRVPEAGTKYTSGGGPMRATWVWLGFVGCSPGPGEPCESSGEGFGRRDPCQTQCVDRDVGCSDGTVVVPAVCAGDPCDADTECPDGWGCAAIDSFARVCLPASCPGGFSPDPPAP